MADRINSEPVPRVRTIAEQRWRERTEAAEHPRDSGKRRQRRKSRQRPDRGGGIDEFA